MGRSTNGHTIIDSPLGELTIVREANGDRFVLQVIGTR
jgi:hypothetical protein